MRVSKNLQKKSTNQLIKKKKNFCQYNRAQSSPGLKNKTNKPTEKQKKCSMNLQCITNASTISKIKKKIKSPIRFYSPLFQVLILGFVAVLHYNSWGKWWRSGKLGCCYVKVLPSYYRPTPTFTPAWTMFGSDYRERMKDIFQQTKSWI